MASTSSHLLLNSLISSFVLKIFFETLIYQLFHLSWSSTQSNYLISIILFSICLGYIFARFVCSKLASKLCKFFNIKRTANENIWNDIVKEDIWVRIWLKSENISYYGQVKLLENYKREPLIVLEYYQILDEYSKPLVDNTTDKKRTVLLNLSQFERIEFVER